MDFEFYAWHWKFRALETIRPGHAGNTLRGALGYALADSPDYQRWFRPEAAPGTGPSGLADLPRPFVLRAMHLDGKVFTSGEYFGFDLHSFDTRVDRFDLIRRALQRAGAAGLGIDRGRAQLMPAEPPLTTRICLDPPTERIHRVTVQYLTPTELKGGDVTNFQTLFARCRDRVATLRSLYGAGPVDIDFRAMGERAASILATASSLGRVEGGRTSSRTRQTHGLGGMCGEVQFEGNLAEFVPWLLAAQWTGVGRQTVWGKGAIRVIATAA